MKSTPIPTLKSTPFYNTFVSKLICALPLKRSDDSSHLFIAMKAGDRGEKEELDALLVTLIVQAEPL